MLGYSEQEVARSLASWDAQRSRLRGPWTLSLNVPRDLGNLNQVLSVGMQPEVSLKVSTVEKLSVPRST